MKLFLFGAEGFGGREARGAPGGGEGGEEAGDDHTEGDVN